MVLSIIEDQTVKDWFRQVGSLADSRGGGAGVAAAPLLDSKIF